MNTFSNSSSISLSINKKKNLNELVQDIRNFYEGITPKLSTIIFDCYTLKKFKLISKKIKKVLHNSLNP